MQALLEDVHDQFSVVAVGQVQQVAAVRLVLACMLRVAMLLRQRGVDHGGDGVRNAIYLIAGYIDFTWATGRFPHQFEFERHIRKDQSHVSRVGEFQLLPFSADTRNRLIFLGTHRLTAYDVIKHLRQVNQSALVRAECECGDAVERRGRVGHRLHALIAHLGQPALDGFGFGAGHRLIGKPLPAVYRWQF